LLCLLGNTCLSQEIKAQEINAKTALDRPLQNRELQAQLPTIRTSLQLRSLQVNGDGLVLAINGNPQISSSRVINPDRVILDLQATEVPPWLQNSVVAVNRFGIKQVRIGQFQKSPVIARLVLDLDGSSPVSWQSTFDPSRNLLLLRPNGVNRLPTTTSQPVPSLPIASLPAPLTTATSSLPTTIDGLVFNGYGQLVIQANRAIAYRSNVDITNNTYNFTIPATRISSQLRRPVLGANSPIEQIRLNQVGDSVVVTIKTIAGWQIQETVRTNPQAIALQLNSVAQVATGTIPTSTLPTSTLPKSRSPQIYGNNMGRQLVVVDAGHGGRDVGATRNGIYEKDIVLAMSMQLGRILQQMGYSVIYTRTEDIELDLEPRVEIAENARASAFVSVHVNSLDAKASQVSGVETYHAPGASLGKSLAEFVHEEILTSTSANDRGVRSARFHVILKTSMPAVLVETGFITNPSESAKLVDSAYQLRMAEAIARGVDRFLKSYR
jgi:N-acetylmuramoyl-L-alanine amidase